MPVNKHPSIKKKGTVKPNLVVGNHHTAWDGFIIFYLVGGTLAAKKELRAIPVVGAIGTRLSLSLSLSLSLASARSLRLVCVAPVFQNRVQQTTRAPGKPLSKMHKQNRGLHERNMDRS